MRSIDINRVPKTTTKKIIMETITIQYEPRFVAHLLGHNLVEVHCYDNDALFYFEGNFLHCHWNGGNAKIKVLDDVLDSHIKEVLNLASESSWRNVQNQQAV
jgi:hypothetical protein